MFKEMTYHMLTKKKINKYHNVKTVIDGITFDSKKEASVYRELKQMRKTGNILWVECHVPFLIYVNEILVCKYVSDFNVSYMDGKQEVIDVKGVKTPLYNLKKKLMKAVHGIDIVEK